MPGSTLTPSEFRRRLRSELPRLLREDPALRQELQDVLQEGFPSRAEVAELRAVREDFSQRFEAVDRRFVELREDFSQRFEAVDRRFVELREDFSQRFEAVDRRFEAMDRRFVELREDMERRFQVVIRKLDQQELHLSRLSGRLGYGLEHLVRGVVEEFAGKPLSRAERLILRDDAGEVFGVPADVEFDLLASNGETYLCEVKSHIEPEDVLNFQRKAGFAARHIDGPFVRLMIGASMETAAERLGRSLGVRFIVRTRVEPDVAARAEPPRT